MRYARSVAWFSTAGFHHRSMCTTMFAAVRLRPVPPALSDNTIAGAPSGAWNCCTIISRPLLLTPPWRNGIFCP